MMTHAFPYKKNRQSFTVALTSSSAQCSSSLLSRFNPFTRMALIQSIYVANGTTTVPISQPLQPITVFLYVVFPVMVIYIGTLFHANPGISSSCPLSSVNPFIRIAFILSYYAGVSFGRRFFYYSMRRLSFLTRCRGNP